MTYSVTKANGISVDSKTGDVTVTKDAQSGEVKVKATSGDVESNEAAITITRPDAELTAVELDKKEVTVTGSGAAQTVTATAYDQFGTAVVDGVVWSIKENADATNVTISGNQISVGNIAKAGTYTVLAEMSGTNQEITFDVKREASVAKTLTVSGGQGEVLVPVVGGQAIATTAFTAEVKDQYGEVVDQPTITWNIPEAPAGVSIANGVVTVTDAASSAIADTTGKTYQVTATCGEASGTQALTVKRDAAKATKVVISRGTALNGTDTIVMPVSGDGARTYTYTAELFDQYDTKMAGTPTWAADISDADHVTFADGIVTVNAGAAKGGTVKITATISGISASVTATVTDLEVDWTGVTLKPITYGDKNSAAFALPASGSANAGGVNVTGAFSVKDAEAVQPVGSGTVKVTVVFTADDKVSEYKGVQVEKDFDVTIAKRPVTATMDNKTKVYGETNPELTYRLTSGTLVGEDTNAALALTPKCGATTASPAGTPVAITADKGESANYIVTAVDGKLTINKAVITGFQTEAPEKEILANDPTNTAAAEVKGAIDLPETVTVTFKDGTADLDIVWADAAEAFDIKGGTYTYKGTVTPGANFEAYDKTLDAKLTVKSVTGTLVGAVKTPVVVAKAKAAEAKAYTDLKLPGSVTLSFDNGVANATYDALTWSVPLDTLKTAAVGSKTSVTLTGLPAWITIDPVTVEVQITDKYPVGVTVEAPANVTYSTKLGDPNARQEADEDGIDDSGKAGWTYLYTGTTAAGKAYSSAEKPTETGTYTVTATLVSATHAGAGTSAEFKILPKSIEGATVALADPEATFVYNTKPFTPAVTVKDGETALVKDEDHTVSFENNVKAGEDTAVVKITGKGNYDEGTSATLKFTIERAPIAELTPAITGVGKVGSVLSAGLKGVDLEELDYQWMRGETKIGESTPVYILAPEDSGASITVVVTAKAAGNYKDTAKESNTVTVEKMEIYGNVVIQENDHGGTEGKVEVGDVLTAVGYIEPAAAREGSTYQWYRNGTAIDGADQMAYTVVDADADATLKFVWSPNENYVGTVSGEVEVGKTMLTGTITVENTNESAEGGKATVGDVLKLELADAPENATYSIVWTRWDVAIPGAVSDTYTVTKEDQGCNIGVVLTGTSAFTGSIRGGAATVPAAAPDAPVVKATAGDKKITLSWTAPADNGAPIMAYLITIRTTGDEGEPTQVQLTPDVLSYIFEDLTNDTEYELTVSAGNEEGPSVPWTGTAAPKAPSGGNGGGGGGSTGGNSGAGVDTSGDRIVADVPAKENKDGGFTASVSTSDGKKLVEAAKKNEGAPIVITPDVSADAGKVTVTLPASTVKSIAKDTKSDVTISTPVADVTMGGKALADLADKAASTVSVTAEKKADGSVSITLSDGKKTLDTVTGGLTAVLPADKDAGQGTVAVLVMEDGTERLIRKSALVDGKLVAPLPGSATVKLVDNSKSFADLVGHWAKDSVDFTSARELFNGTGETTFSPNDQMTRGMLVTVLYRLEGEVKSDAEVSFGDVVAGVWYSDAVAWAAGNKIVEGVGEGTFAPDASITREQLAAMIYRYAKTMGLDTAADAGMAGKEFADADRVSDWAAEAMTWAVGAGLVNGKAGGVLDPNGTATRAEVATVLQRFVEYSLK